MKKIGIVGLGLMGGSIAKALKSNSKEISIIAYGRNEESLKQAMEEKIIDEYTLEISEKFSDVDMVFICTPVNLIYLYVEKLSNVTKEDCIITDVGSTKYDIVTKVEESFPELSFIGGHPMVGSEKSGYNAGTENLYESKYYIITKTKNTKAEALESLAKIIDMLKAKQIVINLEEHDYVVAMISHIPHIVSAGVVNLAKNTRNPFMKTLAAGGFKDFTRIASSSPVIWQSICEENKREILKGLTDFKNILTDFEEKLINNDNEAILEYFKKAKVYRDEMHGGEST